MAYWRRCRGVWASCMWVPFRGGFAGEAVTFPYSGSVPTHAFRDRPRAPWRVHGVPDRHVLIRRKNLGTPQPLTLSGAPSRPRDHHAAGQHGCGR